MSRIAYVNGRYVPFSEASVHIEDRGYQLGDGVYEVCEIRAGALVDERRHMARLARSLHELRIEAPLGDAALAFVLRETLRRNRVRDGILYIQVTRGVARRDHAFPSPAVRPSIVVTARALDQRKTEAFAAEGISVITLPDNRWGRVDIKTIGLLPNVLAKQAARDAGVRDAWFVDENGVLITRPRSNRILAGITMAVVNDLAAHEGMRFEQRPFTVSEAKRAREAFLTSATQTVMPVVRIDGAPVGTGKPGPVTARLRQKFHSIAEIGAPVR